LARFLFTDKLPIFGAFPIFASLFASAPIIPPSPYLPLCLGALFLSAIAVILAMPRGSSEAQGENPNINKDTK
jgi:hypothetical protein